MEKEKERALEEFLENPLWKEYYETAPSDLCKSYIEYEFLYSNTDRYENEAVAILKEIEKDMDVDDWRHLMKYCGNNPFKGICRKRIKELESKSK